MPLPLPLPLSFSTAVQLSGYRALCERPNLTGGAQAPLSMPSGGADPAGLVALFPDLAVLETAPAERLLYARLIAASLTYVPQTVLDRLLGLHDPKGGAAACNLFSLHKEGTLFHLARLVVASFEGGALSLDAEGNASSPSDLLPRVKLVYKVLASAKGGTVMAALQR